MNFDLLHNLVGKEKETTKSYGDYGVRLIIHSWKEIGERNKRKHVFLFFFFLKKKNNKLPSELTLVVSIVTKSPICF
jgi:hypothetical protein